MPSIITWSITYYRFVEKNLKILELLTFSSFQLLHQLIINFYLIICPKRWHCYELKLNILGCILKEISKVVNRYFMSSKGNQQKHFCNLSSSPCVSNEGKTQNKDEIKFLFFIKNKMVWLRHQSPAVYSKLVYQFLKLFKSLSKVLLNYTTGCIDTPLISIWEIHHNKNKSSEECHKR